MTAFADHLWQSLLFIALACVLVALTRRHSAKVRLWLWRAAALKLLLPFSLLVALGGWLGFPVRFPGDPPPARMVALVAEYAPWFSVEGWFQSTAARGALLAALLVAAAAAACFIFWSINAEALRSRSEELRLEADPDDREASVGFVRAALMTACAIVLLALPLLAGSVRASAHAYDVLEANTLTLSEARVTLRPAKPGLGSRYFVSVDPGGVLIRNITVRELTAMAYGVNRFFVRGKHFREEDDVDWLVDSRHDVHIEGPVIEAGKFDTYALRQAITRALARTFGLEIYVNSECQKPCGKWGDRVLLEVAPDSWALVDNKLAREAEAPVSDFIRSNQPARAQFRSLLAAFNADDGEVLVRHLEKNVSAEWQGRPSADEALMLLKQTGGFELLELEDRGPTELKGWVRARDSDALMAVSFFVESEPPHRISMYRFSWGTPPKQYFPARLSEPVAIRSIRAEAASRGAAEKFSGALLVASGPAVLVRGAYGMADRQAKQDNREDTRFRIASITKMFTAVAVLRLAQEGKLRLDEPIGKYVAEIAGKPLARATVHQLLTHTSGAGDIFGPDYTLHHLALRTLADYVKMFADDAPIAPPGKRYQYSNFGYLLLGRLIENVTRGSYYDYVSNVVLVPANMSRTGFEPEDAGVERAEIYQRPAGSRLWIDARHVLDYRGTSAGHAYSTIDDLHRFVLALRNGHLLDRQHTELMLESQYEIWKGNDYGYGAMIQSYEWTGRWIGHAGGYPGMDAQLWFSPDSGYIVIALANVDPPAAQQMADYATARLPLTAGGEP
jgi:CubicO group peptidase (beta-lactamase class C family)